MNHDAYCHLLLIWLLLSCFTFCNNTRYVRQFYLFNYPKTITRKEGIWYNRNFILKNEESKNSHLTNFMDSYEYHKPVLLEEVIQFLSRKETLIWHKYGDVYIENNMKLVQRNQKNCTEEIQQSLKRNNKIQSKTGETCEKGEEGEMDGISKTKNIEDANKEKVEYFIDATLGGGGHTLEILSKIKNSKIVAIDKDIEALYYAKLKLNKYIKANRLFMIHGDFRNILLLLNKYSLPLKNYSGILIDLGVSSHQLKSSDRGFSYKCDAILDMNMDKYTEYDIQCYLNKHSEDSSCSKENKKQKYTHVNNKIHHVLNTFNAKKLQFIMETFGEEKKAKKISHKIVYWRKYVGKITTTQDLKKIILSTCKNNYKANIKVLSRVFQAFRIYVNDELNALKELLFAAHKLLKPNGRLITISYHSLEDKCVTRIIQNKNKLWTQINKEVITPTPEEIKRNKCSRSAKMRVLEKNVIEETKLYKKKF